MIRYSTNVHNAPCPIKGLSLVVLSYFWKMYTVAQVWAIGSEDRAVYFRQGVTATELSGKTWRAVAVLRDGDRPHSSSSSQQR